jgi:hypothetical protein
MSYFMRMPGAGGVVSSSLKNIFVFFIPVRPISRVVSPIRNRK